MEIKWRHPRYFSHRNEVVKLMDFNIICEKHVSSNPSCFVAPSFVGITSTYSYPKTTILSLLLTEKIKAPRKLSMGSGLGSSSSNNHVSRFGFLYKLNSSNSSNLIKQCAISRTKVPLRKVPRKSWCPLLQGRATAEAKSRASRCRLR